MMVAQLKRFKVQDRERALGKRRVGRVNLSLNSSRNKAFNGGRVCSGKWQCDALLGE